MTRRLPTGNGDVCPEDATHGQMHFIGSVQFCPHARHRGNAIYDFNAVPVSRPAPDGHPSPGADQDIATSHTGQMGAMF